VLFAARGIAPIDLDDEEAPDPARLSPQDDDPAVSGLFPRNPADSPSAIGDFPMRVTT